MVVMELLRRVIDCKVSLAPWQLITKTIALLKAHGWLVEPSPGVRR